MTAEQFGGLVRTLGAAAGGWIIGNGWLTASDFQAVLGGVVVIAVAAWSWWQKKNAAAKA
jgi:membrane protein DedA with SNARE-associated domain